MDTDFSVFQNFLDSRQENNISARFYDRYVPTGNISDKGIPEFKNEVFVCINIKDNYDVVDRKAEEEDKRRFRHEYELYEFGKKRELEGTPLNKFAFLTVEQIETCQYKGVFTVEDLSSLSEEKAKTIGLMQEVTLAKNFLDINKNNKMLVDFKNKEQEYKNEIEKLKAEIGKLKAKK